ncbi:MAG: protein-export chaperone SecB [Saprospiraceae bacterium]|nr:protein-export chaperone SecB [Saprospiraceae bacterium]
MKKPEVSSKFQFTNFVVKESHFFLAERSDYEFTFEFTPSGKVFLGLNQFELYLELKVREKNGLVEIDIKTVSFFTFEGTDNIADNPFFTLNAPAIVYPYIRAYISTLTAQSGIGTITMPAMNLISLGEVLKKEIEII